MLEKFAQVQRAHKRPQAWLPPLWYIEGLAEYCGTTWDADAEGLLRDMVCSNLAYPVTRSEPIYGSVEMYKEGQSFLLWLAGRYGDRGVFDLLDNVWRADDFETCVRLTYGRSLADLDDEWFTGIRKRYWPALDTATRPAEVGHKLTGQSRFNLGPRALGAASDVRHHGEVRLLQRAQRPGRPAGPGAAPGAQAAHPAAALGRRQRALRVVPPVPEPSGRFAHERPARLVQQGGRARRALPGRQRDRAHRAPLRLSRTRGDPRPGDRARRPGRGVQRAGREWQQRSVPRHLARRRHPARAADAGRVRRCRARRLARRAVDRVVERPGRLRWPPHAVPHADRRRADRAGERPGHGRRSPARVLAGRSLDRASLDALRHERPVGAIRRARARGAAADAHDRPGHRPRLDARRHARAVRRGGPRHVSRLPAELLARLAHARARATRRAPRDAAGAPGHQPLAALRAPAEPGPPAERVRARSGCGHRRWRPDRVQRRAGERAVRADDHQRLRALRQLLGRVAGRPHLLQPGRSGSTTDWGSSG